MPRSKNFRVPTYPEHAHAAAEVYYVVGRRAAFRLGSELNERVACAGELVTVASHERHELETGPDPMLAVYTWMSGVRGPAYY